MKEKLTRKTLESEQVSFIIHHEVKPDRHVEYQAWLKKIIAQAAKFPGHNGANVFPPAKGTHDYEIVVRFASREDALRWAESKTRRALIKEASDYIDSPESVHIRSGIDYWFTAATQSHRPPKRWKQWLTTVSVIWPLTLLMPITLAPLFEVFPFLGIPGVRQLLSSMILVGLVVYVVMPHYTRLIAKWLSR